MSNLEWIKIYPDGHMCSINNMSFVINETKSPSDYNKSKIEVSAAININGEIFYKEINSMSSLETAKILCERIYDKVKGIN